MNIRDYAFEVNKRADLLALAGSVTTLKRIANTGGGEYAGPCPVCGGKDRFKVQPNQQPYGLWFCSKCTGRKWKDPIDLARLLWPNLKFTEVCERLAGGNLPTGTSSRPLPQPKPAATPPGDEWQALALGFVEDCERVLWAPGGAKALEYLHKRGLTDETIKHFRLGFHPQGEKIGENLTDKGVTIPCFDPHGLIWYVKIRRSNNKPKYRNLKGSHAEAIYNAVDLAGRDIALFCEGEFDCMLAWQELRGIVPAATLGSAQNGIDLATWGRYLIGKRSTLIAYDADPAGEDGAAKLCAVTSNPLIMPLPDGHQGKDITDFYLSGGDLRGWVRDYGMVDLPELGGMVQSCSPEGQL